MRLLRSGYGLGILWLALLMAGAHAADGGQASDSQMRQALVGTWRVPQAGRHAIERLKLNGTEILKVYAGPGCGRVLQEIMGQWRLRKGVLVTMAPDGHVVEDRILSIGKRRIRLRSLASGVTSERVRAAGCG